MQQSLEFILGILEKEDPPCVAQEDFDGPHGEALRLWQRMGFLATEAERNPVPSCPHCGEGEPYWISDRYLCAACRSTVDERHLLLWRFHREAFLRWLARKLKLRGGVRQVDSEFWQLGSFTHGRLPCECFYWRGDPLSEEAKERLLAFRNALLLRGVPQGKPVEDFQGPCLSLVEVLREAGRSLTVTSLRKLLRTQGTVRFDEGSGALFVGDVCLGEVPLGSKEYYLLGCLWQQVDRLVPYADIKHEVLKHSGSRDTTDEATFCHSLKRRIKKKWISGIDQFITKTNKGHGYRLRGRTEP